jgi:hypothetical protein
MAETRLAAREAPLLGARRARFGSSRTREASSVLLEALWSYESVNIEVFISSSEDKNEYNNEKH